MQALAESLRDLLGATQNPGDARLHLDATMTWLCRAQDAARDGGVSRTYHLRRGWDHASPAATGLLIPTFLRYAHLSGKHSFRERAMRMADWECANQMPDGAVRRGVMNQWPAPSIFNAGQVIFGWCAAYAESGDERFLAAARRAGDYLVAEQDEAGGWRKTAGRNGSFFVENSAYNVRIAWALLLLAEQSDEERYRAAADRAVTAALRLALSNGWAERNCFTDAAQPLLHTIAYTLQGFFECGVRTGNREAVGVSVEGGRRLRGRLRRDGQLHGRYDRQWTPTVTWRCLTGEAQMAITWYRIAGWTGDTEWRAAAEWLTRQVCETQRLTGWPDLAGGVKGSFPVFGDYLPYQYPTWAAKFHADALMLKLGDPIAGSDG